MCPQEKISQKRKGGKLVSQKDVRYLIALRMKKKGPWKILQKWMLRHNKVARSMEELGTSEGS